MNGKETRESSSRWLESGHMLKANGLATSDDACGLVPVFAQFFTLATRSATPTPFN